MKFSKNQIINFSLFSGVVVCIAAIAIINKMEEFAIDHSKIPEKVEQSRGFQRWITNLKNKDFIIGADEFSLKEENEIYNTKTTVVYSIDDPVVMSSYAQIMESHRNIEKVIYSPSDKQFLDYRHEVRERFSPYQVHHYGIRDNKLFDSLIVDCSEKTNCFFDRAYFLNNDVFVISELSRNVNKRDPNLQLCATNATCTYTFKLHVIDLVNNSRLVYESRPFDGVYDKMIPDL